MMCKLKRTDGGGSLGKEWTSKDIRICKNFYSKREYDTFEKLKNFLYGWNTEYRNENDQVDLEKNQIFSLLYLSLMVRESSLKLVLMKETNPRIICKAQIKVIILLTL